MDLSGEGLDFLSTSREPSQPKPTSSTIKMSDCLPNQSVRIPQLLLGQRAGGSKLGGPRGRRRVIRRAPSPGKQPRASKDQHILQTSQTGDSTRCNSPEQVRSLTVMMLTNRKNHLGSCQLGKSASTAHHRQRWDEVMVGASRNRRRGGGLSVESDSERLQGALNSRAGHQRTRQ